MLTLPQLGCAERVSVVGRRELAGDAGEDAGPPVLPWGAWAAQLPVPACPAGEVLTVDTVADELEGGATLADRAQAGERLSLNEALWLAHNRPGPTTITFDAAVFPVDAPATILAQGVSPLPQALADTCLDARGRGVIVHWAHSARSGGPRDLDFIWSLGAGSRQVGLQLRALEQGQEVGEGAQVAGCRYFSLPGDFVHPVSASVRIFKGTVGPGNVILGQPTAVLGTGGTVRENFLGFDPRTGENEPVSTGVVLSGDATVEANVISAVFSAVHSVALNITVYRNAVGETLDGGAQLQPPEVAVEAFGVGRHVIAFNTLRARGTGVEVRTPGVVTLSRNRLVAPAPVTFVPGPAPVVAPTLTAVDDAGVHGTCPVGGGVELFEGVAGSAERFLSGTSCLGGLQWTMAVTPTPGRDLVATLTTPELRTSGFSAPLHVE